MSKKVTIGSEFEANNGSIAKVVTLFSKGRAIVRTYHPLSANDFLYDREICVGNLQSGHFRSVDSPNKFGGYIGCGVYNTSHQRIYDAWYNTLRHTFNSGRKIQDDWYNLQHFAAWYVSHLEHMNDSWMLNYSLLFGSDCEVSAETVCLLPREIANGIFVNKRSRVSVKVGKSYQISDAVNLGLVKDVLFVSEIAAISMYCRLKEDKVKQLAEQYKQKLPEHVYQALKVWNCIVDMS